MNRVQQPCNTGTAPTKFHSVFWVYLWLLILMAWFTIRIIFEKILWKKKLSDEPFNEEILLLQTHFGCENFAKKSRIFLLVFVFNLKSHWIIIVKSFENWIVKKYVTRYFEKPLLLLYTIFDFLYLNISILNRVWFRIFPEK